LFGWLRDLWRLLRPQVTEAEVRMLSVEAAASAQTKDDWKRSKAA
jgi:hypothetical protein